MDSPICDICLNSSILCSACQEKLTSGKVSESEISVLKFLFRLSDKVRSLADIKIIKVIDSSTIIIISGKGDAAKIVGKGGSVVKALAKEFGKSIKVIEEADNIKDFSQRLLSPVPIIGVNTIFAIDGERFKIRIAESHKGKMHISQDTFSEIMSNIYKNKAEISFE